MKKIIFIFLSVMAVACAGPRPSLEQAATRYVGAAYVPDPLGEGADAPYDADPIRRTDAFDCLTFVETAVSDAGGADLQKIRYAGGKINWFKRNHWTEADWIPNAVALGLIKPVGTGHSAKTYALVDLRKWYQEKVPAPVAGDAEIIAAAKPFEMSVPYIPRADLTPELLESLPAAAIAFFVRCGVENSFAKGDVISHAGFLFGGDLVHAGQSSGVARVDFLEYVAASKFCGVAVYEMD